MRKSLLAFAQNMPESLRRNILIFGFALLGMALIQPNPLLAQSSTFNKAEKLRMKGEIERAIPLYEKYLKGNPDAMSQMALGECYHILGKTKLAEFWYARAVETDLTSAEAALKYGQELQWNGKNEEAMKWFQEYSNRDGDPKIAKRMLASQGQNLAQDPLTNPYEVRSLGINTENSEIAAFPYEGGILFSSATMRGSFTDVEGNNGESQLYDIYFLGDPLSTKPGKPKLLSGKINTRFHDGPAVYDKNSQTLYFTRSFFRTGKKENSGDGKNMLMILSAPKKGNDWGKITSFSFNNREYSCGHPALGPEGKYIVFASDMPGGYGGIDLYISVQGEEGWTSPVNLGPSINTRGDEMFPAILDDGSLAFSSDGLPGLGGLDIFFASGENGVWGNPVNPGAPVNSFRDDFSYQSIPGTSKAFMTSNRPGGKGKDDIYLVTRKPMLQFRLVDQQTQEPIPGVSVRMWEQGEQDERSFTTDSDGKFSFPIISGMRSLDFSFEKPSYEMQKLQLDRLKFSEVKTVLNLQYELVRNSVFSVRGRVLDVVTGVPIADAEVELIDPKGNISKLSTNSDGYYSADLEPGLFYELIATGPEHQPDMQTIQVPEGGASQVFQLDFLLPEGHYVMVYGRVLSRETGEPLGDASVRAIASETQQELKTLKTRNDGKFFVLLDPNVKQYLLIGVKKQYFTNRLELFGSAEPSGQNIEIKSDIPLVRYKVGEVAKVIYYEYNRPYFTVNSTSDLWEIAYFLIDNPEAELELGSHTDTRGSAAYNLRLSQDRAEKAVEFITSKGISRERIHAKGYGETVPLNRCLNGVQCSEEEHAVNRRAEVRIVGISED
ncbi:MAG: carboxypeptidase regulatory-like domain-containing protein [Bacteroidia bacterium]|nr:carboxypeptidase regulatory-like domain-containing protein [Bacteroidia bacterium]